MTKIIIKKYSCLVFGEGKKDKDFLRTLIDLEKFKFHASKWNFNYSNASGGSAKTVLERCCKESSCCKYDLVLCFVDLDDLKSDYPKTWGKEREKLERQYLSFGIEIIWQLDNAEDEYKRILGSQCKGKHHVNKLARKEIKNFINSDFWKRILSPSPLIIGY